MKKAPSPGPCTGDSVGSSWRTAARSSWTRWANFRPTHRWRCCGSSRSANSSAWGGRERIQVDVRVIAATNRDLTAAVADGTFREDLFYRLNVFPLEMPPLRERREDIPMLVEYFISRYARRVGKTFRRVSKRTLDSLQSYPWPGNVRELQNVIERSVIVSDTDEFTVDESWLSPESPRLRAAVGLPSSLAAHEKAIVEDALRVSRGRVFGPSGAAARLGIPRSTLESKIRALRIDKSHFRTLATKSS